MEYIMEKGKYVLWMTENQELPTMDSKGTTTLYYGFDVDDNVHVSYDYYTVVTATGYDADSGEEPKVYEVQCLYGKQDKYDIFVYKILLTNIKHLFYFKWAVRVEVLDMMVSNKLYDRDKYKQSLN
jgi:hypothetical protein